MKKYKDLYEEIEKNRSSLRKTSIESYILYLQNLHNSLKKTKYKNRAEPNRSDTKRIANISEDTKGRRT